MGKKRVVVVGGGISGLSCAFDLAKDFDVTVLERNAGLGGQSRSVRTADGVHVDYSWRIFTSKYRNLLAIFSQIPTTKRASVRDSMTKVGPYRVEPSTRSHMYVAGYPIFQTSEDMTRADEAHIKSRLLTAFALCEARLQAMEDTTFHDFVQPENQVQSKYIDHIVGPFLGLEAKEASVPCVVNMLRAVYMGAHGLVPSGPYSEAIFQPWGRYLEEQGVHVATGVSVKSVASGSVVLQNGDTIEGEYVVLCLGQHGLKGIVQRSDSLDIPNIDSFAERNNQVYFAFQLCFRQRVMNLRPKVFTVQQAAWLPIVERTTEFWDAEYAPPGFAEQWDVAVLDKTAFRGQFISTLTPEVVIDATIEQMRESDMLGSLRSPDGTSIWDKENLRVVQWPYWAEGEPLRNVQDEYKISCNAGTEDMAPRMVTNLANVFVGGVVLQNHSSIVTQEQACINGRRVARHILRLEERGPPKIYGTDLPSPGPAIILRTIDGIRMSLKLNPVEYTELKAMLTVVLVAIVACAVPCAVLRRHAKRYSGERGGEESIGRGL